MIPAKDLSKEPPRGPRVRLRNYVIMARTIDKCRASIAGTLGEFHFDCPLDNMLFGFKDIASEDFKKAVITAEQDDDVALWFDQAGTHRTEHEIIDWSNDMEAFRPYETPDKREWFIEVCQPLGLDPATATLFDYLDADDKASYPAA